MRSRRVALSVGVAVAAVIATAVTAPSVGAASSSFTGAVDAATAPTDVYPFQVGGTGPISATLTWSSPAVDLNLFLKDPAQAAIANAKSTTGTSETLTWNATTTGKYTITVKAARGAADYDLSLSYPGAAGAVAPVYHHSLGGGTAGHAEFYSSGIDIDPSGNIYAADTGDDQIQKFSPAGAKMWVTGERGAKAVGRFDNPRDVAYLASKVYVADTGYGRVQVLDSNTGAGLLEWAYPFGTIMGISAGTDGAGHSVILVAEASTSQVKVFDPNGNFLLAIGSGEGPGAGQLSQVRDADTDSLGNIYVADYLNDRIAKFAANGTWLANFGVRGIDPGQLKRPYGVDIDDSNRVYVADGNDDIQQYSTAGVLLKTYGSRGDGVGQFQMMRRVAVNGGPNPRVCGADLWTYKIICFLQDGTHTMTIGPVPPEPGFFNEPYGVAVSDGQAFVMDTTNQRIQRFTESTGAYETAFGQRGWGDGNSGFNWARDLTLVGGATGTVWVADTKNSRLMEFNRDGIPTARVLGSPGTGPAQLDWPFAVSSYQADLIVADTKNGRIMRWNPTQAAPTWTAPGFLNPRDVTVSGNTVYVADSDNKRIVLLDAATGAFIRAIGTGIVHVVEGIAVEANGNIWVSDTSWNQLLELSSTGTLIQKFGSFGSGHGQFNVPAHLEIVPGPTTYLYATDMWNDRIEVFALG